MGESENAGVIIALIWGGICCLWLFLYLLFSLCIYKIAKKTGVEQAWLAWIPVVQVVPFVQSAGKPLWWILLLLVPLLNVVAGILLWMAIAERRGKPAWVGLLVLIPFVGLLVPLYLAFSE